MKNSSEANLKKLYSKIPEVKCRPNCDDCCGPVPFSAYEMEQIGGEGAQLPGEGLTCPFAMAKKCQIYEHRPLICRMFGATEDKGLRCRHGCKADKPLSMKETRRIMRVYVNIVEDDVQAYKEKQRIVRDQYRWLLGLDWLSSTEVLMCYWLESSYAG